MPLVKNNESLGSKTPTTPPVEVKSINIADPKVAVIATDNRYTPRINLVPYVSGSEWLLTYYSQILTTESQLSGQQLSLSAVNQQYNKISNLKVKVTSPLSNTQDEENAMQVTGESIMPGFIIPNEGDMFLADLGEGKTGVFKVTKTTKLSIQKESVYEIGYIVINTDDVNIADLEEKTINRHYYHEKFIPLGRDPIVLESKYSAIIELEEAYVTMVSQYFKRFYSKEFSTLLLPRQNNKTVYDHFLVSFLLKMFSTWDSPEIRKIIKLNVDDDDNLDCDCLWTAIYNRNVSYLNTSFLRYGLVDTSEFSNLAISHPLRYSGIDKAVYPRDPILTVDNLTVDNTKVLGADVVVQPATDNQLANMLRAGNLRNIDHPIDKDTLYTVTKDDYYVLSQDFYNKTTNMSVLEGIVWNYIEQKELDNEQLLNTAKTFTSWGLLEQFYYVPIIMVMIKSIIGS